MPINITIGENGDTWISMPIQASGYIGGPDVALELLAALQAVEPTLRAAQLQRLQLATEDAAKRFEETREKLRAWMEDDRR